ncbi:hypothetical protein QNI16_31310 [Cytophagaceae bacterium YF14B1]|uniref:NADP-dependent oxidoreductase domain-containing protein n=1 Tax=Xanthocytophaga flava TaxID=3048013 RepID=A0AAE3UC26_9BACT|nr:hypothetical protein [Xanthocytophaga flavus]
MIDLVQFNYSLSERHAEERLLSVARDAGVATILNRPLGVGLPLKICLGSHYPNGLLRQVGIPGPRFF